MGLKLAWKALFSGGQATPKENRSTDATEAPLIGVPDLADLTAAVNSHHAEIAQLRLEWAETMDKFTAWANRQAARDRIRMKKTMGDMEARDDGTELDLPTSRTAQPMPGEPGMEGIPAGAGNGHRHPKADLYARIRGSSR